MSRNNVIIVSANPQGKWMEAPLKTGETVYPGMCVQQDPSLTMIGGRFQAKIYDRSADGDNPAGGFWIVLNDYLRQGPLDAAFTGGMRLFLYQPVGGEELNLRFKDIAGTGDDHPAGEIFTVDDGTGKFIVAAGTEKRQLGQTKEAITDPTSDSLVWCEWAG